MGVEIPPGYGNAALRFSLSGDPEEMITTFGVDLGDSGGDFVEACNNIARAFGDQFPASQIDAQWTWNGVRIYVGQDGGGSIPYESEGFVIEGIVLAAQPVQNTAILQRKRTARPGRKGMGRFYWPCFSLSSDSYSAAGVILPGTLIDLNTRFGSFITDVRDGTGPGMTFGMTPVLLHSDATAPDPLTAWPVQGLLATQRRRLRR